MSREAEGTGEDTADCEVLVRVVVSWTACELATALRLFVVAICRCSINPITNPNPEYSHSIHVTVSRTNDGQQKLNVNIATDYLQTFWKQKLQYLHTNVVIRLGNTTHNIYGHWRRKFSSCPLLSSSSDSLLLRKMYDIHTKTVISTLKKIKIIVFLASQPDVTLSVKAAYS
jgi:hypothetical protein